MFLHNGLSGFGAMRQGYEHIIAHSRQAHRVARRFLLLAAISTTLFEPALAVQSSGPQAIQGASPVASTRSVDEVISAEKIKAARKAAESDTTLSDPQKQKAIECFDQATSALSM